MPHLAEAVLFNLVAALGFIVGIALGSFAKALADRSLTNISFWGYSYCPDCKRDLRWYDLVPILSFIILKGSCRYCKKAISIEYLLVEVALGILIGFLFWSQFQNLPILILSNWFKLSIFFLELVFNTFFITILAALFITDLKKMLIPDRISIPAIWISLIFILGITIYKVGYLYYFLAQSDIGRLLLPPHSDYFQRHVLITAQSLIGSVLSAALIAAFFTLLIIITKGKGMGGGDVKLGALMGLGLGFPLSLVALILSFLTGAIFSIFLIIVGKKHFGQTIPFGPFLVLGSIIALFWGNAIYDWYLTLGT